MSKQEPIHSGHFMTSNPHTDAPDDEDEDVEVDVVDVEGGISTAVPLDKSITKEKDVEKPVTFYKFGPQKTQSIAIDVSLNKLNKCIRVAYMKMTTPKWKDFKGLKLQWKSRIRLNNVIWRAYYLEFRKPGKKRKAPYCYFSVPDDDTTHTKIEGSLLEGMYWKRRMEAVCAQYKRWRAYNSKVSKKKRCCRKRENSCGCEMAPSSIMGVNAMMQRAKINQSQQSSQPMRSLTPENMISEQWNNGSYFDFDDDLDNEFTNQLFEQLNAPFNFPNPKEAGGMQYGNADIMQPGLISLQPSINEIQISFYTDEAEAVQLIDADEFANSLPSTGNMNTPQQQQQQYQQHSHSTGKVMSQQQQQQQYSAKEYDAANMLINCSSRAVHHQQQQQMPSSTMSQSQSFHRPLKENGQQTRMATGPFQPAMPIPPFTPNVANPLYSQAAVYEPPQRFGTIDQSQQRDSQFCATSTLDPQIGYSPASTVATTRAFPQLPMSTKTANQTMASHPITSMASSPHPSQFLPSSIDYSLLVAVSSAALNQQASNAGPSSIKLHQQQAQIPNQWPWFTQQMAAAQQPSQIQQQQQEIFSNLHQQHQSIVRKSSNGIQQQQQPLAAQILPSQISPLAAMSANSFNSQSLLTSRSPTLPYGSSSSSSQLINNMVSPQSQQQNGGGRPQSVLTAHLQQKSQSQQQSQQPSPLLQSLAASANPQTTVRQFVMSDLSRYLTQQSPIGVNTGATQLQQTTSSIMNSLALNTSNTGGAFSPLAAPHYSPATTPLSAPIIGAFGQLSKQPMHHQQQRQQQQQQNAPQLHSQHSVDLTFSSPPPPKKASTSALPSYTELQQQQQQLLPPKKGRASFSATQRPTHLGKRQLQQMEAQQKQQQQLFNEMAGAAAAGRDVQTSVFSNRIENPSQFSAISPTKTTSRRWSSGRRQQSMDFSQQQQPQMDPLASPITNQKKHSTASSTQLSPRPRRKGQSVTDFILRKEQTQTAIANEEDAIMEDEDTDSLMLTNLDMQTELAAVKEESSEEKPPATLLTTKRRHQSSSLSASSSQTGASSSHSAPADSTLHPEERKRILHLNAEKNRRSALKEGFECLVNAIPTVEQAGVKCTNAVVLNRAAQHIQGLCAKQEQQQRQMKAFREKITNMNERIALLQSNLPSSSTSGTKADTSLPTMRIQVEQFFERTKRDRSREDFRFYMMCEVLKPLVNSFAEQIHPNADDRERVMVSARKWLDTHWNSAVLRPIASDTLVRVATTSGAFTNEKTLSKYVAQQVNQQDVPGITKPQL